MPEAVRVLNPHVPVSHAAVSQSIILRGGEWDDGVETNHVSVAAVMYFKLSAKELEILAERDTVLKRLADNQVGNSE